MSARDELVDEDDFSRGAPADPQSRLIDRKLLFRPAIDDHAEEMFRLLRRSFACRELRGFVLLVVLAVVQRYRCRPETGDRRAVRSGRSAGFGMGGSLPMSGVRCRGGHSRRCIAHRLSAEPGLWIS